MGYMLNVCCIWGTRRIGTRSSSLHYKLTQRSWLMFCQARMSSLARALKYLLRVWEGVESSLAWQDVIAAACLCSGPPQHRKKLWNFLPLCDLHTPCALAAACSAQLRLSPGLMFPGSPTLALFSERGEMFPQSPCSSLPGWFQSVSSRALMNNLQLWRRRFVLIVLSSCLCFLYIKTAVIHSAWSSAQSLILN